MKVDWQPPETFDRLVPGKVWFQWKKNHDADLVWWSGREIGLLEDIEAWAPYEEPDPYVPPQDEISDAEVGRWVISKPDDTEVDFSDDREDYIVAVRRGRKRGAWMYFCHIDDAIRAHPWHNEERVEEEQATEDVEPEPTYEDMRKKSQSEAWIAVSALCQELGLVIPIDGKSTHAAGSDRQSRVIAFIRDLAAKAELAARVLRMPRGSHIYRDEPTGWTVCGPRVTTTTRTFLVDALKAAGVKMEGEA